MPARLDRNSQTSRANAVRRLVLLAPILAILATAVPLGAQAAATKAALPKASTGGATAVRGTSATLLGTVDPNGAATSYHFQYGPTLAYGKQTAAGNLPAGTTRIKVGQAATGLLSGYHYRLVASNANGEDFGKDRTFGVKRTTTTNKFALAKSPESTVFGETYVLGGTLSGPGNANRAVALQASPYPFLEAFTTTGAAGHTDAAGRFSFRVANLTRTTQFRVSTLDPRPIYSRTVTEQVAVKVTLKVRSSGHPGLVRLYGTVTPAKPGAHLDFQLLKKVRPGSTPKAEERTTKYATQFSTLVKRATSTVSRFSVVVKIRRGGSYRAYVKLSSKGPVAAGWSRSLVLHSAPASTKR